MQITTHGYGEASSGRRAWYLLQPIVWQPLNRSRVGWEISSASLLCDIPYRGITRCAG